MLRLALSQPTPQIKVVNDQFGSLTWSYRLAEQLAKIIATGGRGIYHATAEGYATWFEVARLFFAGMGIAAHHHPLHRRPNIQLRHPGPKIPFWKITGSRLKALI